MATQTGRVLNRDWSSQIQLPPGRGIPCSDKLFCFFVFAKPVDDVSFPVRCLVAWLPGLVGFKVTSL